MVSVYLFVFWPRALTKIDPRVGIRLVLLFKSHFSVVSAAVRSKAVALFVLIYCLLLLPLFWVRASLLVLVLFCSTKCHF